MRYLLKQNTPDPLYEKRYPYLDRSLLEFLYAIPREQLVRPGQRRSLARRALVGIVPDELLERRRKAFVVRGPMTSISAQWPAFLEFSQRMLSHSLGIVDSERFSDALQSVRHGQELSVVLLMRTLGMELWLRALTRRNTLNVRAIARSKEANKVFTKNEPMKPVTL